MLNKHLKFLRGFDWNNYAISKLIINLYLITEYD
nr:hypothetical protein [Mucilaginibacter sp. FT3.2]